MAHDQESAKGWAIVGGGCAAVLVLDTIGSLASLKWHFPYSRLAPISFAIYGLVGFLAARNRSMLAGVTSAAIVGLVDATVGWAISWHLGPGAEGPLSELGYVVIPVVVIFVILSATFMGFVGALANKLVNSIASRKKRS